MFNIIEILMYMLDEFRKIVIFWDYNLKLISD